MVPQNPEIKYKELYNILPCGCFTIDSNNTIIDLNETFLTWAGYARFEVLGALKITDFLSMGGRIFYDCNIHPLLILNSQVEEISTEIINKKGEKIPVLLNAVLERDEYNNIVYTQFVLLDIFQRNLYEKELLYAKKKADDMAAKLAKSNKELNQFANTIAHDIQSPLTNVLGLISMLKKNYGTHLDRNANLFIELIEESSIRMNHQVSDLLNLSIQGHDSKDLELVNLNKTLEDVKANLSTLINSTNTQFKITNPLPEVLGFSAELVILFQNIIKNSIQNHKSGIDPVIKIISHSENKSFRFEISDNGSGIEEKYHDQIFLKHFKISDTSEGTGLGLFKCKSIVDNHKGIIGVDSRRGEGCTIFFTLEL